jgi:hypothetical protein
MRIPFRAPWRLRALERELRRTEPHLAAMLAIFAKLNAGEAIVSREQAHRPGDRTGRVLAGPTWAHRVPDRSTGLPVRAGRLIRIVRTLLVTPAEAAGLAQPPRPLRP